MEYMIGGDMKGFTRRLFHDLGEFPIDWVQFYIREATLGIQFLHSNAIIHRYAFLF